jgi:hypothetical protein
MNIDYATYLADQTVRTAIDSAARRARSEAMRDLVFLPLVSVCGALLRIRTLPGARLAA